MLKRFIIKFKHLAYKLIGRDSISYAKIHKRHDLQEFGSAYGGWVIPTDLVNADSICYCAGCGEDITFDLALIGRFNCHVYAFDPTPRAIEHVTDKTQNNSRYHFEAIGLWDKQETLRFYVPKKSEHVSHSLLNLQKTEHFIQVPVNRLCEIMSNNIHRKLHLLKLDIEGAEYKVLQSVVEDDLNIDVICVEFDECCNPLDKHYQTRIKESIEALKGKGYQLVYIQNRGNYTFVKS